MVYYRKYRPQKIEEIDSIAVRETLLSVLSKKEIPHAFLFTGPKGLGKTSTARIVAKIVNCEKRKDAEPCNKCNQCTSTTNGTNLDVIEIDAASNRGIDEIRDLREKIRLAPISAVKKVYIIDEVHMLTTEAFNALLKTLEEPPLHALFILCTTEPHKVPATIISRCFHIGFNRATEEELVRSLKRIVKGEKLAIDKEAFEYIAALSDGSFRDGAKILEELSLKAHSAGSGQAGRKKITGGFVEENFKTTNIESHIDNLMEYLALKDVKGGLLLISKLVEQGIDMKYFIEQAINKLHSILLVKTGVLKNSEASLGFTVDDVKSLVELLSKAYSEVKFAVLPQLPLELAVVEWGLGSGAETGTHTESALRSPRQFEKFSNASAPAVASGDLGVRSPSASLAKNFSHAKAPRAASSNDILQQLIEKVKPYNHSVAGVLRGCSVKSYDGKKLVIETGYKFHKERLEEREVKELLEKVAKEINGQSVNISIMLKLT